MIYRYTIIGKPITKKNSQQLYYNKKLQRPMLMQSEQYRKYESTARIYLKNKPPEPINYPVEVVCTYYMPEHRKVDLTNLLAATDDILVHYGILADDNCRILVSHDGSRVLYSKNNPRVEILIAPYEYDEDDGSLV